MAIDGGFQGNEQDGGAMHHATRMVDEARAFKDALSSSATNFSQTLDLRGRVERNPIGMVLAAAGIGYVLGGGLFSPLTGKLVKVGMRLALVPLVKSQLGNLAGIAQSDSAAGPV